MLSAQRELRYITDVHISVLPAEDGQRLFAIIERVRTTNPESLPEEQLAAMARELVWSLVKVGEAHARLSVGGADTGE